MPETPQRKESDRTVVRAPEGSALIPSTLPMRAWLHAWLFDSLTPGNYRKVFDRWIALLIVANLFALLFEHVDAVYAPYKRLFHWFEALSIAIFTLEYLLRLYVAPEDGRFRNRTLPRLRYMRSPFALIDLLAIVPFFLQAVLPLDLRFLRFLRLLRILKLFRVLVPAWREFVALNEGRTFRQKMHAIVFPGPHSGAMHGLFDNFVAIWVVISVLAVVLESVQSIHYVLSLQFIVLDTLAVAVFTTEYCMRLYCCVEDPAYRHPVAGRWRLARTPSVVIDLLAIVPFFLEALLHHLFDLRFLRVFRLLRLFKLTRYTGAISTLTRVVAREWPVMGACAFVMLLLVIMTASLGYLFEHEAQPDKFENIPQAIYWAVITLASVGYGDITPVTPMGRLITIILALMGIGIFAVPAALLSSAFTDELTRERNALKEELYSMLADGMISPDEEEIINREARRLHLSHGEVQFMIEKAKRDRATAADQADLPLHRIATVPAHAVEHYKMLVGQIRQLGLLTDTTRFAETAISAGRLTEGEWDIWLRINGIEGPPDPSRPTEQAPGAQGVAGTRPGA